MHAFLKSLKTSNSITMLCFTVSYTPILLPDCLHCCCLCCCCLCCCCLYCCCCPLSLLPLPLLPLLSLLFLSLLLLPFAVAVCFACSCCFAHCLFCSLLILLTAYFAHCLFCSLLVVDYWYRHHGSTIRGHYIGYDMSYDASYVYDRDCLFVSYRIGNMTRHLMGNCITSPVAIYLLYIAR